MRSLVYDELLKPEIDAVLNYLNHQALPSGVENIYWLALPRDLWNQTQIKALAENGRGDDEACRAAIEVGRDWVRFELLLRSEDLLNTGGGQADERQTMHILRWAEEMAQKLGLGSCCDLSSGRG